MTELERTQSALFDALQPLLRFTADEAEKLFFALEDYVDARAEAKASAALDREFNRGDYRS